jgi:hypothetical protein
MPGERAKDNKTLTAACASCGKETPTDLMIALIGGQGPERKSYAICKSCHDKGWRPPGYAGF